jgi:dipeptidase
MDLLRLGLERATTATEALEVITSLLERHGQGGDCGHLNPFFYHNGFIIADGLAAYVLETVGRWWACERVTDHRALSNAYSIGRTYDRLSVDLARHAATSGWTDADGRFDFAERFIDLDRDAVSFGRGRCDRGTALLARQAGKLNASAMVRILRDHGPEGEAADWTPEKTLRRSICMHAAEEPRRSQTTASLVTEWRADGRAVHWVTASAAPCLSIFKPVLFGTAPPAEPSPLTDRFNPAQRWWRHELLHRRALADYARHARAISGERDELEARFAASVSRALEAEAPEPALQEVVARCWREADEAEARWFAALARAPAGASPGEAYAASWREHDRIAAVPSP